MKTFVGPASSTARLRAKNQLTLPQEIVNEVGIEPGDRFRITAEEGVITLVPIRRSYYGAFAGLWPDDWMEDLRREREAWSRREPR
jgi:bifunctional DNA-binding transcriptional regulator/antitoxin component of YhaV-PrlF toxin-antitoxin module